MVDVSKYKTIPEFFEGFMKDLSISPAELARKLEKSPTAISVITNKQKRAGKPILEKMSEVFQLDLNQLLQLEQIENPKKIKIEPNVSPSNFDHENTDPQKIKEKPKDNEKESEIKEDSNDLKDLNTSNSNQIHDSELQFLIGEIDSIGSERAKRRIKDAVRGIIDQERYSTATRYTHRDIKDKLVNTFKHWKSSSALPGYGTESNLHFKEFKMKGYLETSETSVFFKLTGNEQYAAITTRYQDRQLIEEYLRLIPGIYTSEARNGNLGNFYSNVPLYTMRVFNPASIVREMKIIFSNQEVSIKEVSFEDPNIEPYFKY